MHTELVTSDQSRLDFVSAVPMEVRYGYTDDCADEFIAICKITTVGDNETVCSARAVVL